MLRTMPALWEGRETKTQVGLPRLYLALLNILSCSTKRSNRSVEQDIGVVSQAHRYRYTHLLL